MVNTLATEEVKQEKRTIEKIIEQIGPYGLIAVCITLIVNVASKPLDSNSWVSIGTLVVVMLISFFFDWLRIKNSRAIEEIRIKSQLELEKHISWEEHTQPLMDSSRTRGQERMAITKAYLSIIQLLRHDINERELTDEQKQYCEELIRRLEDIERTTLML
jgi:hypothetical protein